MIPDRDIWRAANLLIRKHGVEDEIVAARRARTGRPQWSTGLASDQTGDRRITGNAHGEAELAVARGSAVRSRRLITVQMPFIVRPKMLRRQASA
jgi:hypothetical protein